MKLKLKGAYFLREGNDLKTWFSLNGRNCQKSILPFIVTKQEGKQETYTKEVKEHKFSHDYSSTAWLWFSYSLFSTFVSTQNMWSLYQTIVQVSQGSALCGTHTWTQKMRVASWQKQSGCPNHLMNPYSPNDWSCLSH